jgi:maltose/moltooligosaccharide transporter
MRIDDLPTPWVAAPLTGLLVATVMGSIMRAFFPDQPIWTMAFAATTLVLAALATLRVERIGAGIG